MILRPARQPKRLGGNQGQDLLLLLLLLSVCVARPGPGYPSHFVLVSCCSWIQTACRLMLLHGTVL